MFWILRVVIAIVLMVWMFRQVRKPSGPLGKSLVRAMSVSHSKMTDWGLQQASVPENAAILDIGCGGGRTVRKLTSLAPAGKLVGMDCSAASVAVARETNAEEIAAGRVEIEQGSVSAMPFADGTFDVVTAVETHYYWPALPANVREVLRVGGLRSDRRNLPRRAAPAVLRHNHAAAAPGGIQRGHHHALSREKLDLRHRPQADIEVPFRPRPTLHATHDSWQSMFFSLHHTAGVDTQFFWRLRATEKKPVRQATSNRFPAEFA